MTVHYSEGSARAVVRNGTVVVLPAPAAAGVVDALWTALDRTEGGVAATLAVLAANGLAETPPFAVVSLSGGEPATAAHVAVRGTGVKVVVSAEGADGPVEVTGSGVVTWSERMVDAPTSFAITTDEAPADEEFPVQAAVVRASALRRTLVDVPEVLDVPALPATPDPGAAPDTFPAVTGVPIFGLGGPASSETIVPGALDVPEVGGPRPGSEPAPGPEAAPEPAVAEPAPLLGLGSVPGPAPRTEVDESTQFGAEDDYGHLFGDTVMRRVEDAAVRQGEDDEDDEEEHAEPVQAPAPAPTPAPLLVPEPPQPAEPEGGALISGIPGGWSGLSGPPEPPPGVTPGAAQRAAAVEDSPVEAPAAEVLDHDGETMMSSDIAALRKAAGASVPKFSVGILPGGPQILGRKCPQGHPNPPTSDRCRGCGQELEGDAELVSRPSLGQMLVTGGVQPGLGGPQVVELDRPVIVGRRPRTNNASADRTPRLVTVASPDQDISRSHVEITLEEWHVLVADLATTNGTTLLRPGQQPRRLHPNEKVIVVEGDVVDLGDGATLTFEGIW